MLGPLDAAGRAEPAYLEQALASPRRRRSGQRGIVRAQRFDLALLVTTLAPGSREVGDEAVDRTGYLCHLALECLVLPEQGVEQGRRVPAHRGRYATLMGTMPTIAIERQIAA